MTSCSQGTARCAVPVAECSAIQSRASWQLTMTTIAVMGIGVILPYSPLAQPLGFVPLPWQFWPWLGATLLCYVALAQLVKTWLARKGWI